MITIGDRAGDELKRGRFQHAVRKNKPDELLAGPPRFTLEGQASTKRQLTFRWISKESPIDKILRLL